MYVVQNDLIVPFLTSLRRALVLQLRFSNVETGIFSKLLQQATSLKLFKVFKGTSKAKVCSAERDLGAQVQELSARYLKPSYKVNVF